MNRTGWYIVLAVILSSMLAHFNHFERSPRGIHVWRQCNTLAVARNYQQESMDLFQPRVDHRQGTNGVTGMSFPAYEYSLALTYKLTGFANRNHRILQFLIYALGILMLFKLGMLLFNSNWSAGVMALVFAWSPEMYYHGINALPDVSAMTAITTALFFYFKTGNRWNILWAMVFLTLAALIKLQFALFGPLMVLHSLLHRRSGRVWALAALGLLSSAAVVNWYIHSIKIRYANGLQDYGLFLNPADSSREALAILKNNLLMDIPEQIIGYGLLPLVLLGFVLFFVKGSKTNRIMGFACLALFGLFHIMELKQMIYHAYYMMPYVLFGAVLAGYAMKVLKPKVATIMLLLLVPAQLFHSLNKIQPRYSDESADLPSEFLDKTSLNALQNAIGHSDNALVGPDPSGCIYFYFLECKGWNAFGNEQILEKDHIQAALKAGRIDCIAVRNMTPQLVERFRGAFPYDAQIGNFTVMRKTSFK